ncbi:MAG TPA: sigma-70 family RNA polymerase sigma factor [Vicinamibacteria bacterium]|jgi:RNA polymerase sigma-70 factor (ECF subfamily)|nr:sigma-70 family RNA polymerase sigma factor [Vicinamibacteria bacterium]
MANLPPAEEEDLEAIRAVLSGDDEAFRPLVDKYSRSIFNLAYRMTGNAADAEDMAQEAFLQAFARLGDFRVGSRFHPWLYTIALNLCRSHLRRRSLPRWLASPREREEEGREPELSERSPDPEQAFLAREAEEGLQTAVASLPVKYREVFVLRQSQELSYEEIAALLGLPLGTVEVRLFRARRLLLKSLEASNLRRAKKRAK